MLSHRNLELADHLFLKCDYSYRICHFFKQNLGLYSHPQTISEAWSSWISSLYAQRRLFWDFLLKAIFWNLWLLRNNLIFNLHAFAPHSVLSKIIHMLLDWISTARDPSQRFPDKSIQNLKHSLDFLSAK